MIILLTISIIYCAVIHINNNIKNAIFLHLHLRLHIFIVSSY